MLGYDCAIGREVVGPLEDAIIGPMSILHMIPLQFSSPSCHHRTTLTALFHFPSILLYIDHPPSSLGHTPTTLVVLLPLWPLLDINSSNNHKTVIKLS